MEGVTVPAGKVAIICPGLYIIKKKIPSKNGSSVFFWRTWKGQDLWFHIDSMGKNSYSMFPARNGGEQKLPNELTPKHPRNDGFKVRVHLLLHGSIFGCQRLVSGSGWCYMIFYAPLQHYSDSLNLSGGFFCETNNNLFRSMIRKVFFFLA